MSLPNLIPLKSTRIKVFIVLHWFLLESGQFLEFQGNQFWHRGLPNWLYDSSGMVPGFTWTEWHPEQQEWNPRCPNWASANANTWFGCHQPINSFFLNHHHHHHRQCPSTTASSPLSPHHHHHVIVTITIGHHHPHLLPTTTTMWMTWQRHVTQWTMTGHNYTMKSKVPCHWQQHGKQWTTT